MRSLLSRTRKRTRVLVVTVALAAAAAVPLSQVALASSDTLSGSFNFKGSLVIGCPVGAVLCTHGSFTGGVSGNFQFSILTLIPSATVGVDYYDGKLVLHTLLGDIKCDLNGALNENPKAEGEFGEICVINGGTGLYKGATGDFRLIGTSSGGLTAPMGGGVYQGRIVTGS